MNEPNYPEVAQATTIAEQSYELALAVKVDSPEMYEVAGDELRSIVTRRKKIEELRLSLTRPIDEAKRRIMDLFRGPDGRLGQAESLLRDEMTRYQREEREKAEAARREAEAKAAAERAEQERIAREAEAARRKAEAEAAAARKAGDEAAAKAAAEAAAAQRRDEEEARERVELADVAPAPHAGDRAGRPDARADRDGRATRRSGDAYQHADGARAGDGNAAADSRPTVADADTG